MPSASLIKGESEMDATLFTSRACAIVDDMESDTDCVIPSASFIAEVSDIDASI